VRRCVRRNSQLANEQAASCGAGFSMNPGVTAVRLVN
jgi:hypothetical protein